MDDITSQKDAILYAWRSGSYTVQKSLEKAFPELFKKEPTLRMLRKLNHGCTIQCYDCCRTSKCDTDDKTIINLAKHKVDELKEHVSVLILDGIKQKLDEM